MGFTRLVTINLFCMPIAYLLFLMLSKAFPVPPKYWIDSKDRFPVTRLRAIRTVFGVTLSTSCRLLKSGVRTCICIWDVPLRSGNLSGDVEENYCTFSVSAGTEIVNFPNRHKSSVKLRAATKTISVKFERDEIIGTAMPSFRWQN
jgi:hypothetical protein